MKKNAEKSRGDNLRFYISLFFLASLAACSVTEAPFPLELSGRVVLSSTLPSTYKNYKIEKVHVYSRSGTKLYGTAIPQQVINSKSLIEWHWKKLIAVDDGVDCTFWVELSNPANKRVYYNQGTEDYIITGAHYDLPVSSIQIPIFTPEELRKIGTDTALYPMEEDYVLIRDIQLSGEWEPFGTSAETAFSGDFNGNYRTISNLRLAGGIREYIGFFGYIRGASVKNLILALSPDTIYLNTTTKQSLGTLTGYAENSTIENVLVRGGPNGLHIEKTGGANFRIGGIVGTFTCTTTLSTQTGSNGAVTRYSINSCGIETPLTIKNLNLAADVDSSAYGGIAGLVYRERGTDAMEIKKCYSSEIISASIESRASGGGIVGLVNDTTDNSRLCLTISESYNSGDVSGEGNSIYVGGMIGRVMGTGAVRLIMQESAAINAKLTLSAAGGPTNYFINRIIGGGSCDFYTPLVDGKNPTAPMPFIDSAVFAFNYMILSPSQPPISDFHNGLDVTHASILQESWYINSLDFDFNDTWVWDYRLRRPVFKWLTN